MKVLYFHQHFSTPQGATGTRSYEFSRALVAAGHDVKIICGSYWIADSGLKTAFVDGKRSGIVEGINVTELELPYSNSDSLLKRSLLFLKYSLSGIRIALKQDYDILFASSTPLTASIPGIVAKLVRNKPFIFEVRDLWPELPRAMGIINNPVTLKLLDGLESISYKYAAKCIALAPGIAEGITRKYPRKEIVVIPNGSDKYQGALNLTKGKQQKFIAVFTGAHGVANGLDAVLDVAVELKRLNEHEIEIQFIGDGKLKQDLIKRSKQEELSNCQFLDPMSKIDLFRHLADTAHVGLMVLDNIPEFYRGTSPNKFFDYISLGLPVIMNYPGWLAGLIKDKECGLTVSPGSATEFAEALIYLKDHQEIHNQMSSNSHLLSVSSFDRLVLANKFVAYLESTWQKDS